MINVCIEFKVPIYNDLVQVVLTDSIWEYFKTYGIEGKEADVKQYSALTLNKTFNPKPYSFYVLFNDEEYDVSCIGHEAFHIATGIMRKINTPLNENTEESYAYLLSYLIDILVESLFQLKLKKLELLQLKQLQS